MTQWEYTVWQMWETDLAPMGIGGVLTQHVGQLCEGSTQK